MDMAVSLVAELRAGARPGRGRGRPGRAAHRHHRRAVVGGPRAAVRQVLRPRPLPPLTTVAQSGAFEQPTDGADYNVARAREAFEFGLPRVLDGIEAFIDRRAGRP